MTVEFVVSNGSAYRVATKTTVGDWPGDRKLRSEFESIASWARKSGLQTGDWFFRELDDWDTPVKNRRWEAGVEVRARKPLRGEKGISIKTFPRTKVVSVTFDPGKVSPELVYFGLEGWLWWQRKSKKYRRNGPTREVYRGNPWKSKSAWSHTQVQVPIKRL
ncbi:MAG: GyrI-like domain-containing protein [Nitrososphaerota archaeon]|nr:GyrI-like domain-containing protein [Nitrososphaerota archaeon]